MTKISILASNAIAMVLAAIPSGAFAADSGQPQYYELRVYTSKSQDQQKLVSDYWQNAAVPAYNRTGIQPIGVFTELEDSPTNKIYVLIPFDSLDAFAAIPSSWPLTPHIKLLLRHIWRCQNRARRMNALKAP